MSKPFIVVGDKTSHGGVVIEGSPTNDIDGKAIARVGDKVTCPKKGCHSPTVIVVSGDVTIIVDGKPVALHGDKTACGATLISSQFNTNSDPNGGGDSGTSSAATNAATASASSAANDNSDKKFDEKFLLKDGNGQPLAGMFYTAKLPSGELVHGQTDDEGHTKRFYTDDAQNIEIHIGHLENV